MTRRLLLFGVVAPLVVLAVGITAMQATLDAKIDDPAPASPIGPASNWWRAAAPGVVEPNTGIIRLGFVDTGKLAQIRVRAGALVHAGDLLARLSDAEQQAHVRAAEAELGYRLAERDNALDKGADDAVSRLQDKVYAAEQGVAQAQFELDAAADQSDENTVGLRRSLDIARNDLSSQRAALRLATATTSAQPNRRQAAVESARADLELARVGLEKTALRAPFDGVVLEVTKQIGEIVSPSSDDPVITVGGNGRPVVRAELDEIDAGLVKVGDKALVRGDGGARVACTGVVTEVAPLVGKRRLTAVSNGRSLMSDAQVIRIELAAPTPILPGTRVDAFFTSSQTEHIGASQ